MRTGRLALACVVLACTGITAAVSPTSAASVTRSATVPPFAHVVVLVMENTSASSIIGNTSQASYINSLAGTYAYSSNDFAISHPSLPNYLALTGASTFGIASDCAPSVCPVNAANLMDRIESAGLTWKAYMESMPSACDTTDAYPYAVKHDPFVYYNDIHNNSTRCQSHVVPFTQLSADLQSASTTPTFSWITPNMCNDMHDCSIATGDTWLSQNVPAILGSPAFTTQNSLLVVTWDEDDSTGSNQVDLVLAGSQVARGMVSSMATNHYSILSTLEAAWNMPALNANDSTATTLGNVFANPGPVPVPVPGPSCTGVSIAASPPPAQMAGSQIVFTGGSNGCTRPLYEFWARWQGHADWQLLQGYSTSATYRWNSTGASAGTENIGVWVKDAGSTATVDAFTSTPFSVMTPSCASLTVTGSPGTVAHGSSALVTISGTSTGCSSTSPLYEFWMRPAWLSKWQLVQGYSTSAAYSWNSAGAPSGSIYFGVWVKDAASTNAVDAYVSVAITVT